MTRRFPLLHAGSGAGGSRLAGKLAGRESRTGRIPVLQRAQAAAPVALRAAFGAALRSARSRTAPPAPRSSRAGKRLIAWRLIACRAGLIAVAALPAQGCERAAPGPEECVEFARAWLRPRRPATPLEAETAFDDLVRRCLTEPYDRELVSCVVQNPNQERCRVDYARRVEARREERRRQ